MMTALHINSSHQPGAGGHQLTGSGKCMSRNGNGSTGMVNLYIRYVP